MKVVFRFCGLVGLLHYVTASLNGHFLMIGDVHLDLSYGNGSQSCNEGVKEEDLKPYGNYECDSPYKLLEDAFNKLNNLVISNDVDFIVWMGDTPGHMNREEEWTKETFLYTMQNASDLLHQTLPSGVPLLPVIGNHDYFPTNELPGNHSEIYELIGEMWRRWLPEDALTDFKNGGYYTVALSTSAPKLRAIVLNSNLYYTGNWVTEDESDPGNQFQWLESELQKAVDEDEKIHLILHIPTGPGDTIRNNFLLRKEPHTRLNSIIRKYSSGGNSVILGAYGTHVHSDSFKMYYENETNTPVASIFVSPSVTPWRWPGSEYSTARNPAMRMFDFDPAQLHLTDIKQYYLELPKANNGTDSNWKLEYGFQEAFGVTDITPTSLHQVLIKFKQTDSIDFEKYLRYNVVSLNPEDSEHFDGECDDQCKWKHLCAIEFIDVDTYMECMAQNCPDCDKNRSNSGSVRKRGSFLLLLCIIPLLKAEVWL